MHLSIGIATWNRSDLLSQTLDSLCQMHIPAGVDWEILVCDNNSTDATRPTVECFRSRLPIRYLFEPTQGKSYALNRIIAQACGEWLLFLDDDIRVSRTWLEGYLQGIRRYPRAGVLGGPILPGMHRPLNQRQAFLLRQYPAVFGVLEIDRDQPMRPPHLTAFGANLALRREALRPTPQSDPEGFATDRGMMGRRRISGEDVLMVQRILNRGWEGWLLKEPSVQHCLQPSDLTLRRFWRWHAALGQSWALADGGPLPGRFGIPFWAWRRWLRLLARAALAWRPWPTKTFFDRTATAAQYRGWLRGA